MPTVLWIGGLAVRIYLNDHRPMHVHVIGNDHEAVFLLNSQVGEVSLRENYGFSRGTLRKIEKALIENLKMLCGAWVRIHGIA